MIRLTRISATVGDNAVMKRVLVVMAFTALAANAQTAAQLRAGESINSFPTWPATGSLGIGCADYELREDGFNVDDPIIWNYLFVHRDYPQLGRFIEHMRRTGYQVAEVNEVNDGETGVIDYELRLQIVERHTSESLAKKLSEMRHLAAKWEIDLFDGWYPEGYTERREMSH